MVLHKTLHLARNTLSKTLAHGYAQSVVAASQSSYATQNNTFGLSRFSKTQNHQYHHALTDRPAGGKDAHDSGSLAAYYAAWSKSQKLADKDGSFLFPQRIGWTPSAPAADENDVSTENGYLEIEDAEASRPGTTRAYSDSAIDDLRSLGEQEAAALASIDEQIRKDIGQAQQLGDVQISAGEEVADIELITPTAQALSNDDASSNHSFSATPEASATLPTTEAQSFADQLNALASSKHYAVIPAVFMQMINRNITPTPSAYNALLAANIHSHLSRQDVVRVALDIYSDIIQRRIVPDLGSYTTLIELLSKRALEVASETSILEEKRTRYGGLEDKGSFLFRSTEKNFQSLTKDGSLAEAVRMFDEASELHTGGSFPERTYCYLVSALAEHGSIDEMARVYAHMESRGITPRADTFVNMIRAFATAGNLPNAVEAYNEYKEYARAHNDGKIEMIRKDNDVYAAVIKAFTIAKDPEGASQFLTKLEASLLDEQLPNLRDIIGLKAFIPEWLKQGYFEEAFSVANSKLNGPARDVGLKAVAIRAADRNQIDVATRAFEQLSDRTDLSLPAMALGAMHIRNNDQEAAEKLWPVIAASAPNSALIESTTLYAICLTGNGQAEDGIALARAVFGYIRDAQQQNAGTMDQISEALNVVHEFMAKRGIVLSAAAAAEFMNTFIENDALTPPTSAYILAGLGPEEIAQLSVDDMETMAWVQSNMIVLRPHIDVASSARFGHMVQVLLTTGERLRPVTEEAIDLGLSKIDRPDIVDMWSHYRNPVVATPVAVTAYSQFSGVPASPVAPFEDSYDPYATTTDSNGSSDIAELLEKTHGSFSSHLKAALTRLKNMRRLKRHPRFYTYGKLIMAAAKDNNSQLAHEILAMAKVDVPFRQEYRIVRHGWSTILDAMVSACLTTGHRRLAEQFHQELLAMGSAPSANTFGQYITTLKGSTQIHDEASEAVNIFLRAKAEGVEPSSFLYNVLIGKLGKARRIDDCLFYYQEMRDLGIHPTSVTYGTIINALCRVSDEKFAEQVFEEMESMPNYKPRPAPYHSIMQHFLNTKRDRSKVLQYYERMRSKHIQHTSYTYKLLIDTYATLEPVDMEAAEGVLQDIRKNGELPEAVHFASLIHAKGCVLRDMEGARALFDSVIADRRIRLQPCLFQALFEAMVANHQVQDSDPVLAIMSSRGVEITPYIANGLIHGWSLVKDVRKAEDIYNRVSPATREPSLYEAMTRAYVANGEKDKAMDVVREATGRGYPAAVQNKIIELVAHESTGSHSPTTQTSA